MCVYVCVCVWGPTEYISHGGAKNWQRDQGQRAGFLGRQEGGGGANVVCEKGGSSGGG